MTEKFILEMFRKGQCIDTISKSVFCQLRKTDKDMKLATARCIVEDCIRKHLLTCSRSNAV